ncbi:hypothetical protein CAEBREN_01037 [Caenorhabditis brenneri]|uniref:Uncharacterized protein n=1 Tax=Caenorhabditis brenneri TaxID=135651 RepID=G0M983_CAEBE|nr:hypothetical protein CAEBREN_01037 [Caenorhabditis brenneri]
MDTSHFSTPEFLTCTLHILSIFSIPIHILGFYCIIFETPTPMKSAKLTMLNLHFWSISLDVTLSILVCPSTIIPVIGGYTFGVLNKLGVPAIVQWYMILTTLLGVGASFVSIIENRYFMIFAVNSWWRHARPFFIFFNYIVVFTGYIPPFSNTPNQSYAFSVVQQEHPTIPVSPSLFVITLDRLWIFLAAVITGSIFVTEVILFNTLLMVKMRSKTYRTNQSLKTFDMQRKFLIGIAVQMNFLSTPEFLTSTLHILSILTTPIHILGFYCILFKTPKSMESVKWCLLNSHFLNIFMDISINILVCPVVITPVIGGYTYGILNQFGVPTMLQWYLLLTVFLAVGAIFVSIVENRYYMMFARSSCWRHGRYPFLVSNYFFVFTGYIPPLFNVPDGEYALRVVEERYP